MKYDDSTPRTDLTIQGTVFSIPQPFAEGHVCTANEAQSLNQTLAENVRNNFAQKMKKAEEDKKPAPTQAELDAYVDGYEFGERRGGGGSSDPVAKEAMNIARDLVKAALVKKGHKISDFKASKITELAQGALAKRPEIMDQARAVVAEREKIGAEELDLDLGAAA